MTLLPLAGQASAVAGFNVPARSVLRLRNPHQTDVPGPYDAALIVKPDDVGAARARGFAAAVVIGDTVNRDTDLPASRIAWLASRFGYLEDGEIIGLDPRSRRFRSHYRRKSAHNTFLVTERCDNYCLMCSQPPRDVDDHWILDEIAECIPLLDPGTASIGFTGGEPLLEWQRLMMLLARMRDELPATEVHVLTNGRAFARPDVAAAWAAIAHRGLCAGIPIYSSVDTIHDHVVQAHGAFDETVLGVLRLKDKGQRVEIRVVLHALTTPRLVDTCAWFARNLPFVDHVALMGMENTGFALANKDLLWIDPMDYQSQLTEAVLILKAAGVRASVYNLPRCVLDPRIWPHAVQSISDWKNAFPSECEGCVERLECGGFFSTGRPEISRGVRPFLPAG